MHTAQAQIVAGGKLEDPSSGLSRLAGAAHRTSSAITGVGNAIGKFLLEATHGETGAQEYSVRASAEGKEYAKPGRSTEVQLPEHETKSVFEWKANRAPWRPSQIRVPSIELLHRSEKVKNDTWS